MGTELSAGQIPLGTGLAYAQKYLGTNRVTLAYMGDGAINQGAVHEAMNLAALWKLPIIYIIENNEYSMGTSIARSSAGDPLTKRAGAFDMAAIQANGMDLDDVRAKTFEAVSLARTESQPTLMEIRTYRYFATRCRTRATTARRKKSSCASRATRSSSTRRGWSSRR